MEKKFRKEMVLMTFLLVFLLGTTAVDLWTALSSPVFELAEANPIYILFGNIWGLLFATAAVKGILIYLMFKKVSLPVIYFVVLTVMYMSVGHLLGAYTNITTADAYHENPEQITKALEQTTNQEKINFYAIFMLLKVCAPLFLSWLAFFITYEIYELRRPRRDKIIEEIKKLSGEL